jgi:DNA (cytosine-5)-methyltransferase 1
VTPAPVFYNDNCVYAAAWLRNLTSAGHLPAGVVDDQDIERITPDALKGFKECHFFAGVGGWSLALRLAGWPLGRPVWTGSCPCQPFSSAGKRKGTADSRHLWPEFLRLIAECRPPAIFGEQVASKLGRKWLARVRFDLEALGYGVGAADLCGACVGAPHIRQRLYWVADRIGHGREGGVGTWQKCQQKEEGMQSGGQAAECGRAGWVGHADPGGCPEAEAVPRRPPAGPGLPVPPGGVGESGGERRQRRQGGAEGSLPDRKDAGREQGPHGPVGLHEVPTGGLGQPHGTREAPLLGVPAGAGAERTGGPGFWNAYDLVYCRDDKVRRVESGLQCLVDGSSFRLADGRSRQNVSRSNLLRGIGNAIIPQVAAMFVRAYLGR